MKKVVLSVKSSTPLNRPKQAIAASKKKKGSWLNTSDSVQYQTVLFIPATTNSSLARMIRRCEENNSQERNVRIKVVESSGRSVKNTMAYNYPWAPEVCRDPNCFPCSTGSVQRVSCRKPGMAYRIFCILCSGVGISSVYEGETGKCLYERGKKHLSEFQAGLSTNAMVIHNRNHHPSATCLLYTSDAADE